MSAAPAFAMFGCGFRLPRLAADVLIRPGHSMHGSMMHCRSVHSGSDQFSVCSSSGQFVVCTSLQSEQSLSIAVVALSSAYDARIVTGREWIRIVHLLSENIQVIDW